MIEAQKRKVLSVASRPDGHPLAEACILKGMEMAEALIRSAPREDNKNE